jgi:hypothetical protein
MNRVLARHKVIRVWIDARTQSRHYEPNVW